MRPERRTVALLFCDVVGSTALAEGLDAERWADIVQAAFTLMAEPVQRFGGIVCSFRGDAILALFGAPVAHDDDSRRAVLAGLEIAEGLAVYGEQVRLEHGIGFSVRVGIHTGPVFVGWVGPEDVGEYTAMGDAANLAARMQQTAEPGTVQISEHTHRLVEPFFTFEPLGPQTIRGQSAPVRTYRVVEAITSGTEQSQAGAVTGNFLGRVEEMRWLQDRLGEAAAGAGLAIGVIAEAGAGKSRLLAEFIAAIADRTRCLQSRCLAYGEATTLQPFAALVEQHLDSDAADAERRRVDLDPPLADLLGRPVGDAEYQRLKPLDRRSKMLTAIADLLASLAADRPLVIVIDDLQWADPTSLELIEHLIRTFESTPVMLLLAARPDLTSPWASDSRYHAMKLPPLPPTDEGELLRQLLDDRISPQLEAFVHRMAGGNPFFVEELCRELRESKRLTSGEDGLELGATAASIPVSVEGVLTARMDRLDSGAAHAVKVASVVGIEFPVAVLLEVVEIPERLERQLQLLSERGFIRIDHATVATSNRQVGRFVQALTREVAYSNLTQRERRGLHGRVARALEHTDPSIGADRPELLANHLALSDTPDQAIPHLYAATQRALARSANNEAITAATRALELLHAVPETPARLQQELDLQVALGAVLTATKGAGAAETEHAYGRARELCKRIGNAPQLASTVFGLWRYALLRAHLREAEELAGALSEIVAAEGSPQHALALEAAFAMGATLFWSGQTEAARGHLLRVIQTRDVDQRRTHVMSYGQDPVVVCQCYDAFALCVLGRAADALDRVIDAATRAGELQHPFSRGYALYARAMVHQLRGEADAAEASAVAGIDLAQSGGFPYFAALCQFVRGWARAAQGEPDTGIEIIRTARVTWESTGSVIAGPYYLDLLAECYAISGDRKAAAETVREALELAERTGESWLEPELQRLDCEVRLLAADPSAAERVLREALQRASERNAWGIALRVATTLAAELGDKGDPREGQQIVAAVRQRLPRGADWRHAGEAAQLEQRLARRAAQ